MMQPTNSAHSRGLPPHADQKIFSAGPSPEKAAATLILIHGRGASGQSMLTLYDQLGLAQLAALAPQAFSNTWYPNSFLAAIDSNQPWLDSALAKIDSIVTDLLSRGIPAGRIALLGFSQGACLTSEYIARHPRPYGAAMMLTGALIGPPGTPRNYPGILSGTRAFLGNGDSDPHVPLESSQETEKVLTAMGANVDFRVYPNLPHTINADEFEACQSLLRNVIRTT